MLYKKGLPAIYLNMEADKQAILDENRNKAGIYLITNKINKKHYVGKSSNLCKRFANYFSEGFLLLNKDTKIYNILRKLGYNNFSLSILEYCDEGDLSTLSSREQYYIDIFKPLYNTRKFVIKSNTIKVTTKTRNSKVTHEEAFTCFRKKFNNQAVPTKVLDLINLAETSDDRDFYMQVNIENEKKGLFIFNFVDYKRKIFYYANSALWDEGDILPGGYYDIKNITIPD